jgi:hypothetical protein
MVFYILGRKGSECNGDSWIFRRGLFSLSLRIESINLFECLLEKVKFCFHLLIDYDMVEKTRRNKGLERTAREFE